MFDAYEVASDQVNIVPGTNEPTNLSSDDAGVVLSTPGRLNAADIAQTP